ncbi:MAG: hypothetical protein ACHQJ4_01515 [Ignavibacteria bacterium]
MNKTIYKNLLYVFLFAAAFAWVESSVVVYLRTIYYPAGFRFPIKTHYDYMLVIELIRELATLVMMVSLSVLLSKKFWEGFGYFLVIFGLWDILFYIWLKVMINWPESLFTFDILFLIPVPWIAPVLAPVIVSLVMIYIGIDIIRFFQRGLYVKPGIIHWAIVLAGTAFILYSFMCDIDAGFHEKYPQPYNWILFLTGIMLFLFAHFHLRKSLLKQIINKSSQ